MKTKPILIIKVPLKTEDVELTEEINDSISRIQDYLKEDYYVIAYESKLSETTTFQLISTDITDEIPEEKLNQIKEILKNEE